MDFNLTEEQKLIRDSAHDFLQKHLPPEKILADFESLEGYDVKLWQKAVQELGWTKAFISKHYDGLGLGLVEAVLLVEQTGRFLFCPPLLASIFLCADLIDACGSQAQKNHWLPKIASGEIVGTATHNAQNLTYKIEDQGFYLSGKTDDVLEGAQADLIIALAHHVDGQTSLFLVPAASKGLKRENILGMDRFLRKAHLYFDEVHIPLENRMHTQEALACLETSLHKATIVLAAMQMGGASQVLDLTLDYINNRVQFGRTIGSFQAVKHKCADMMIQIESARSAVYYAAALASEKHDQLKLTSHLTKAYCSDIFFDCAAQAIQLHGGMGFTWDYVLHLYFKHAQATQAYWGSPNLHRAHLADMIHLEQGDIVWI